MSATVTVERIALGNALLLRLGGVLDERFEASTVFANLPAQVALDLHGIKRITSFGVRQWSDAMKGLPSSVQHLYLVRAPACFVDQLNMVLNFGGRSEVVTATALYYCERCQEERAIPIDVLGEHALLASGAAPPAPCPTCGLPMALEEDPQQAFRFVANYAAKNLSPEIATLLAREALYTPRKIGPPPEEMKLISGDVTLLVLSGTIDQRFRPRRLAAGVEGEVVLDTGGISAIDATGIERFGQLMAALDGASSITLVEVPEPLLREILSGALSLGRAQLASVMLTFSCQTCGAERQAAVTREQGSAYCPPCELCGEPTVAQGAAASLQGAFATPAVLSPAVTEVIAKRAELISRARAESGVRGESAGSALGRYRVLRPLSRGGMAEILLAVHEGIGGFEKLIALKKIRRKLLERGHVAIELFLNEAKIVANLNHPNIVQTFEVGEHGGDLFIAMEYVHGVDARTVVKRRLEKREPDAPQRPQLTLEQILYIGTQIAAALDHAHKARDLSGRPLHIVHRDVSLSNIVLGFDGQVKLVDFGIATASSVVTKDGLIGKFSYMSPEQVQKEPLDGRSDVFSLGIVLFELIAGRPLFRRGTDEETLRAVREDAIPSLAEHGVSPEIEEVLHRALARRREERYADARAFELALQGALQRTGGMSAHQLSLRMREMFPEESAASPTAGPLGGAAGKLPSPTGDSGSHSSGLPMRSRTFATLSALESDEESATADMPPELAARLVIPPAKAQVSPAPVAGSAAVREDDTPVLGTKAFNPPASPPAPAVVVPAQTASAGVDAPSSKGGRGALVVAAVLGAVGVLLWVLLRG